ARWGVHRNHGADHGAPQPPSPHPDRGVAQHVALPDVREPAHHRRWNDRGQRRALRQGLCEAVAGGHERNENHTASDTHRAADHAGHQAAHNGERVTPAHGAMTSLIPTRTSIAATNIFKIRSGMSFRRRAPAYAPTTPPITRNNAMCRSTCGLSAWK